MSNVKCHEISWHVKCQCRMPNVKYIIYNAKSDVKCEMSCQMSNVKSKNSSIKYPMYFAKSVDLVRSQYILWDLSRSCAISVDLVRSQQVL